MEIKEVSNEPITGESLLSMIEESVSENKKSKQTKNEDITEEEIMEDDEFDVQEVDYDDDDDEVEDDSSDDADGKKSKIGKKEILMFVALGVSVIVMGTVIYMMLFAEEDDAFDAVAPLPTQKIVPKPVQPVQQVKPIAQQQPTHQQIKQIDKNSGEPEPLKPINPNLQQPVQQKNVQQQQNSQMIKKNPQTIEKNIDKIEVVDKKPIIAKPKTIHFTAKSKEDVGINQFAVIGNKAYLSSDLFEKTEFNVEDKEYNAKFNGRTRSFLKVVGEDSIYLPAKQVADNYSVEK